MNKKHFNITVYGKVHGVFFRAGTRAHAKALEVFGFVRNESNGTVYIEAEGEEENLKQLIEWCHRGSERAEVAKVEVSEGALKNFSSFEVKRGIF